MGREEWAFFSQHPFTPELWGVNYYPEISVHSLERDSGRLRSRSVDGWTEGLEAALSARYQRYAVPLFVSETSMHGHDSLRSHTSPDGHGS